MSSSFYIAFLKMFLCFCKVLHLRVMPRHCFLEKYSQMSHFNALYKNLKIGFVDVLPTKLKAKPFPVFFSAVLLSLKTDV